MERLLVVAVIACASGAALADRAHVLDIRTRTAMADQVVVAKVSSVAQVPGTSFKSALNHRATLEVVATIKGKPPGGPIALHYYWATQSPSPIYLEKNKTYLFFLIKKLRREPFRRVIDRYDGAIAATPDHRKSVELAAKDSCCQWRDNGGIRILVMTERLNILEHETNLIVYAQNLSGKPAASQRVNWPRNRMTHAALDIRRAGKRVPARSVPWLNNSDLRKHFGRNKPFRSSLRHGDYTLMHLQRIRSAKSGWGYKQRLGFKYYPGMSAGEHLVRITVKNWFLRRRNLRSTAFRLHLGSGPM